MVSRSLKTLMEKSQNKGYKEQCIPIICFLYKLTQPSPMAPRTITLGAGMYGLVGDCGESYCSLKYISKVIRDDHP